MKPTTEEQLRLYATAVLDDAELRPMQSDSTRATPKRGPGRWGFALAAACLVAVAGLLAVVALRSDGAEPGPATTSTTAAGLHAELRLSTTTPRPDETVTAELTLTNVSEVPVDVPDVCRTAIVLYSAEVPTDPVAASVDGSITEWLAEQAKFAGFHNADVPEPLTGAELQQLVGDGASPDGVGPCEPRDVTLRPGDEVTATKRLAVGAVGLPAGPGQVRAIRFADGQPIDLGLAIELPDQPGEPISRAAAIELALALPEVQERIATMSTPGVGGTTTDSSSPAVGDMPLSSAPPDPPGAAAVSVLRRTTTGWQIGYAQPDGYFLVDVTDEGNVATVAIG